MIHRFQYTAVGRPISLCDFDTCKLFLQRSFSYEKAGSVLQCSAVSVVRATWSNRDSMLDVAGFSAVLVPLCCVLGAMAATGPIEVTPCCSHLCQAI